MNEVSPHVQRMLTERYELYRKELLLQAFIEENEIFKTLPSDEQRDMQDQLVHMSDYRKTLERRIKRAEGKQNA